MSNKCPNCGKSFEDSDSFKCPNCHIDIPTYIRVNLENLKKSKDFLDTYKDRIDLEVNTKVKAQVLRYIGMVLVVCFVGFLLIYLKQRSIVDKITASRVSQQLKEPEVKQALNEFAKSQASEILNKAKEDVRLESDSFKSYLDESRAKFGEEYNTISQETALLKERNRLAKLANTAISEGSRNAFKELSGISKNPEKADLSEVARAEIMRVKAFYATNNRLKGKSIQYTSPKGMQIIDDKLQTATLLSEVKNNADWQVRAKFAELLKDRKEKGVAEALLEAACSDTNLDVSKQALESFEYLTGYKSNDILDCESAQDWWKENKQ